MINRFYPALFVILLGSWLLLNQSLSPAYLASGVVIAFALTMVFSLLEIPKARLRNLHLLPLLAWRVTTDIVHSNLAVATIIVRGRGRNVTSGFVDIPLEMRSRYGLALLACIITSAPGTVWVSYEPESGMLNIHVLDLIDETAWVERIKTRYEGLLMEIFE